MNEIALIVISEEAELLIPIVRARAAGKPKVHLIAYAAPVTKSMLHFNRLSYYALPCLPGGYTLPDWLPIELGIFAGRLYIDFPECAPLMKYLELAENIGTDAPQSKFEHIGIRTKNPVEFLLEWLTICRKGQDIMHTPMGYICQGRPLRESHPFFAARSTDLREIEKPPGRIRSSSDADEAEDRDLNFEDDLDVAFTVEEQSG